MRYLETLESGEKVGGVVFVAGFISTLYPVGTYAPVNSFVEGGFDFRNIKSHCNKFIAIQSDDDPHVPLEKHTKSLKEDLGAEIIIKHGMKHFSGVVDGENSCIELPDVVDAVLKLSKV